MGHSGGTTGRSTIFCTDLVQIHGKNGNGKQDNRKNGNGRNGNRKIGQPEKSATKNKRIGKHGNTKLTYEITATEKGTEEGNGKKLAMENFERENSDSPDCYLQPTSEHIRFYFLVLHFPFFQFLVPCCITCSENGQNEPYAISGRVYAPFLPLPFFSVALFQLLFVLLPFLPFTVCYRHSNTSVTLKRQALSSES